MGIFDLPEVRAVLHVKNWSNRKNKTTFTSWTQIFLKVKVVLFLRFYDFLLHKLREPKLANFDSWFWPINKKRSFFSCFIWKYRPLGHILATKMKNSMGGIFFTGPGSWPQKRRFLPLISEILKFFKIFLVSGQNDLKTHQSR